MSMTNPNGEKGSLERLGIAVSTGAPEDILTPNAVKAARFRKSKPWGYLADDVQNFVDITQSSVQWYRDKLHERDEDIHRLGKEIDNRESQIVNLNLQLASASYNSNVSEAISRNAEDKEMTDLLSRQQTLENDLLIAQREAAGLREQLAAAPPVVPTADEISNVDSTELDGLRQELTAAQTVNARLTTDLEQAQTALLTQEASRPEVDEEQAAKHNHEMEQLREQNMQLDAYNRQMEAFADEQEAYINTLLAQIPQEDDALVEDAEGVPHDGEGADLTVTETAYDIAVDSATEEPEEQTYATDIDDDEYDAANYDVTPPIEIADEVDVDEQPALVSTPEEKDKPVYMYNGVRLPPGIKPEDL